MTSALVILLGLLGLCPVMIAMDGPLPPYLVPLLIAAGLILVSVELAAGEAQHLSKLVSSPLVLAAAFPPALMVIQMLPLPFVANPVWMSVSPGFPHGVAGSISVDIGATALTLMRYLTAAGMVLLAATVTIKRERAESVLLGTTVAVVAISLIGLFHNLFGFGTPAMHEEVVDCACLGVTLSSACALFVYERYETRRFSSGRSQEKFVFSLVACLIGFVICASTIAVTRSGSLIFAAGSGFFIFCAVAAIRRWALGRLGAAAIGVTAAVVAAALVTVAASDPDPRFAFVAKDTASFELTQRILSDAPFWGDGAGSFSALLPIYQSSNAAPHDTGAVTSAAKISIEMGKAFLWLSVLAAAFAVFFFLRGATQRGRDSFFAAASGGCLFTLMNLAFVNAGLSGLAIVLLSATIFGLGLSQSKGRVAS